MMRAGAVLFDKDGTLLDFQRTWGPWLGRMIDELAAGDAGLAQELARVWSYERSTMRILPDSVVIAGTVNDVAAAVAPLVAGMSRDEIVTFLDKSGAMVSGVPVVPLVAFFDELAAMDLPVGIATNDSETTARCQLRALDIEHRFAFIAGYDSGFGSKPEPGMCSAFAEHLRIEPQNVVMVGDSNHDLAAGRAAGMQTVAVLTGVADADALSALSDIVLPDIGHLVKWLRE